MPLIEYIFYIQDFWATCACPEKQSVPWVIFIIQNFWATCACPKKQSCPENFYSIEIFFIIQGFWATYPESRVCPEIFQAQGSGSPSASYAYDGQA